MKQYALIVAVVLASAVAGQDMPLSQVLIPAEGWKAVGGKWNVTCIAADADGKLYIAHSDGGGIETLWKGKRVPFAKTKWTVTAMAWAPDGSLLTLSGNTLSRRTPGAEAKEIRSDVHGVAVSPKGGVYYTRRSIKPVLVNPLEPWAWPLPAIDMSDPFGPPGREIYRLGQDKPVAEGLTRPAAMAFWRDGGTLVVGEYDGDEAYTYRVGKDGSLDAKEGYYTLRTRRREPSRVTALLLDADGRLYAATDEGIQVFDPTGRLCGVITLPTRREVWRRAPVRSMAFAGPEREHLYVEYNGKVFARKTKIKGFVPSAKRP